MCKVDKEDLDDLLPNINVRKSLKKLESLDWISITGARIIVGESNVKVRPRKTILFSSEKEADTEVSPLLTKLKSCADKYGKMLMRKRKEALSQNAYLYVEARISADYDSHSPRTMLQVWRNVFFLTYREEYREFTQKDSGQMKNLFKTIPEPKMLINMIIQYLIEYSDYGDTYPNIGHLSVLKDKVRGKVKPVIAPDRDSDDYKEEDNEF